VVQSDRFPLIIEGQIELAGSLGPFDNFAVRIEFPQGYPFAQPWLFETGGRIPHEIDRHVFSDGHACLEVWEAWLARTKDWSVRAALNGPVRNFLLSQSQFERTETWPFGEHAHGAEGQLNAIKVIVDPEAPDATRVPWLIQALHLWPAGHNSCLCGSGRRFRDCHRPELEDVKAKFHPIVLGRLFDVVERIRAMSGSG
jgi:hypothetical protein